MLELASFDGLYEIARAVLVLMKQKGGCDLEIILAFAPFQYVATTPKMLNMLVDQGKWQKQCFKEAGGIPSTMPALHRSGVRRSRTLNFLFNAYSQILYSLRCSSDYEYKVLMLIARSTKVSLHAPYDRGAEF